MANPDKFYLTTAIDYPNSLPHIGTAFEKIGADVQARYQRLQGRDVFFLMGNDENTVKVSKRAAELGRDVQDYCDDMARQFQEVWRALDVSFDDFIQTSEKRHHDCCRKFIQKVYDNGHIYKGTYEGWYCEGCEEFKSEQDIAEAGGVCPNHKTKPLWRSEPCWKFAWSKFQERLIAFYEQQPDFIKPESRRNEVMNFVQGGLTDLNLSRVGQKWGIHIPFDEEYTIYVWFDALLNYITAIGYGTDEERFKKWWPADIHFIGKDITRFHCALWPAMLWAAGVETPKMVFGHGFINVDGQKMSKALGNVIDPLEVVQKGGAYGSDACRYYFLSQCPFPGDGDFSWKQFHSVFNADLANNLGNLYSRVVKLLHTNYQGRLAGTGGIEPGEIYTEVDTQTTVKQVSQHIEACQYNQALQKIWFQVLTPANQYLEKHEPWKLVKTDKEAAKRVLHDGVEQLRVVAILLKPFLPKVAKKFYTSFNFSRPWESVRYEDVFNPSAQAEDVRLLAELPADGKVPPLFPRLV